MNKRIIIHGAMRSATTWVASMLHHHVDDDGRKCDVEHEMFRHPPLAPKLDRWTKDGIHISVGFESVILDMLHQKFPDLQVAFLVRNPLDQLLSMVAQPWFGPREGTHEVGSILTAAWHWGPVNTTIGIAKALGLDARVWHFDYYTTVDGFCELADSLGLNLKRNDRGTVNACDNRMKTSGDERKRKVQWTDETRDLLWEFFRRHEHLSPAYDEAKAYADEKLGRTASTGE